MSAPRASNPFYVNPSNWGSQSSSYIISPLHQVPPFIYTNGVSFCVGIGLLYYENGKIEKLGMYHSVGEHLEGGMNTSTIDKAMREFLHDLDDTSSVKIITFFSKEHVDQETIYRDNLGVMTTINKACVELNKKEIP